MTKLCIFCLGFDVECQDPRRLGEVSPLEQKSAQQRQYLGWSRVVDPALCYRPASLGKTSSPMHAWPLSCPSHKDISGSPDQFLVHVHDHSGSVDGQRLPENLREAAREARDGPPSGGHSQQALGAW